MIFARLLSATLETDGEHWNLAFQRIQDVWGTDAFGQNPPPYQRGSQLTTRIGPPYPWRPGDPEVWGMADALFPGLYGFQVVVNQSNSPTTLDIYGTTPINALPPSGFAPQCPFEATVASTGGHLKSGTYLFAVGAGSLGPVCPFFVKAVIPPGVTTGAATISGVVWQMTAGLLGGPLVWGGTSSLAMRLIAGADYTSSTPDTFGNDTVFTITGASTFSLPDGLSDGQGLPDPVFNSFLFQAKTIIHGGVWGDAPSSVAVVGGVATATFPAASWTVNQWAGYVLSSYGPGPGTPYGSGPLNYLVASNTATTLTFATVNGPLAGSAVVMRAAATFITATTIGDANFVSSYSPGGLTVNAETGNLVRIIAGTGKNQPPIPILSNTATVVTLAGKWAITPDATSVYIIEGASWTYSMATGTIANNSTWLGVPNPFIAAIPIPSFLPGSLLIEGITVDVNGNWSVERYAPLREIYVPATTISAAALAAAPYAVPITSVAGVQTATPDASQRANLLVLTAAVCSTDSNGNKFVNVAAPINYSTVAGVYTVWQLITQEDPVGMTGGYSTVFDPVGGTYRIGFSVASPASPANTQCHVDFKTSSAGVTTPTGSLIDQPI